MSKPRSQLADITQQPASRDAPRLLVQRRFVQQRIVQRVLVLGLSSSIIFASLGAAPATAAPSSLPTASAQTGVLASGVLARSAVMIGAADKRVSFSVKTRANLNMRQGASAKKKSLLVVPKNTTLKVSAQASNGWYKVSYKTKTGYISNAYATKIAAKPAPKPAPKPVSTKDKPSTIWVKNSANLNLRASSRSTSKSLLTIPKNTTLKVSAQAPNGWYKVSYKGKTGYISNAYVKKVAAPPKGGRAVELGGYSTNRAGLTDRFWTKNTTTVLYESVGGKARINDIPRNSVAYRDLKLEKKGGQLAGWYFVRTQGTAGWVKTSALKRSSNAPTSNTGKFSYKSVKKMTNGKVDQRALVAMPWDMEKTLIAAPAAASLNKLNAAFKKQFGKNLSIDLSYRTRATQNFYWVDLGPYIAARPGTSNHGWGTAVDFPETYDYSFRGKYYKWLKKNSHKFGWVHRKNLEEGSPYAEAWHFEYYG